MAFQRSKVEEFESQGPTARLKPKRVTLGEFAGEFERLRTGPTGKRLSVGTLSDYVRALTKLRKSIGDDTPLESITGRMSSDSLLISGARAGLPQLP